MSGAPDADVAQPSRLVWREARLRAQPAAIHLFFHESGGLSNSRLCSQHTVGFDGLDAGKGPGCVASGRICAASQVETLDQILSAVGASIREHKLL